MKKAGFWCLVLLAFSSAAPNSPRAPEEEKSEQNKTAEELEDQSNVLIEVRKNIYSENFKAHSLTLIRVH